MAPHRGTRTYNPSVTGQADPLIYGGAAVFLASLSLLASWIPAWRAARIDPMLALRCQ